jgi:4-amino-4-deoxy-L-arabinose transferase-like glycosyltransferase
VIVFASIALALLILGIVLWLLLTRKLREKYAVLWLVVGLAVLVVGLFPQLLLWLTDALGVELPLSWELSQAEDEIRRTAEEIALLRARVDALTENHGEGVIRQSDDTESSPPADGHDRA